MLAIVGCVLILVCGFVVALSLVLMVMVLDHQLQPSAVSDNVFWYIALFAGGLFMVTFSRVALAVFDIADKTAHHSQR